MQIEVGEYKTRDGVDVTVVAVVDGIAIGYFSDHGPESVTSWRADNGRFWGDGDDEDYNDLVRKKPKRINREAWLTVRSDIGEGIVAGGGYESLELAKQAMGPCCIAIVRVEIDCEEGENLD